MRLRKAGLSGFPVISYLQNRSISPKRPFFHNRKPMQKGDIAAVQRDPKDKTLRLQAAGNKSNQSNESDKSLRAYSWTGRTAKPLERV